MTTSLGGHRAGRGWPHRLSSATIACPEPEEILPDVEAIAWADFLEPYFRAHVLEILLAAARRRGSGKLDALLANITHWIAAAPDQEERAVAANILLDFPRPSHRALLDDLAARQSGMSGLFDKSDVERSYAKGDQPGRLRFATPSTCRSRICARHPK